MRKECRFLSGVARQKGVGSKAVGIGVIEGLEIYDGFVGYYLEDPKRPI